MKEIIPLKSSPFQNQKQHYMRYLIYSNLCICDKRITQKLELELGNLYYYVKTDPDDIYRVYEMAVPRTIGRMAGLAQH